MKSRILFMLLLPAVICIPTNNSFAQKSIPFNYIDFNAGSGYSTLGIPFYLSYEIGGFGQKKAQRLSGGNEFSYHQFQEPFNSTFTIHLQIGLLVNINFHFLALDSKHDLYCGISQGFLEMTPVAHDTINFPKSSYLLAPQIGYHCFFTSKVGFNIEVKAGEIQHYKNIFFSEIKVGLTIRFKKKN